MGILCSTAYAEVNQFSSLQDTHEYLGSTESRVKTKEVITSSIQEYLFNFKSSGCTTSYVVSFDDKDRSGHMGRYRREISIDWTTAEAITYAIQANKIYIGPTKTVQYTLLNGWKRDNSRSEKSSVIWYVANNTEKTLAALEYLQKHCKK